MISEVFCTETFSFPMEETPDTFYLSQVYNIYLYFFYVVVYNVEWICSGTKLLSTRFNVRFLSVMCECKVLFLGHH